MASQNMLNYPIETITTRNGQISAAQVQTYKWGGAANAFILPYKSYNLESGQLLTNSQYTHVAYSAGSSGPFVVGGSNAQMRLKTTWVQYDSQSNPIGLLKDGGLTSSYLWDYNKTLLVAKVENALPNEVFHDNFEGNTRWDVSLVSGNAHVRSGQMAGYVGPGPQGYPTHCFGSTPLAIALTAPRKFIVSGWVYSEGPNAQLWLHMYRPGETRFGSTYVDYVDTREVNKWVYLEKLIEVPVDVTTINLRLTNFYRASSLGSGNVWFDDLRIHPADAQMTTYTHAPGIGITSMSDGNNRPTYYEYDALNRLSLLLDQNRNVLKQYQYHYRTQ